MSLRKIDAYCPTCQHSHPVEIEVTDPPPREIIKEVVKDDSEKINKVTGELTEAQRAAEALRGDLQRWQSGENHLSGQDMLNMLQGCPNCRPTLDTFIGEVRDKSLASLTLDQVKEIARQHKLWPPPTIDLGLSRKARP